MVNKNMVLIAIALIIVAMGVWWYLQTPVIAPTESVPAAESVTNSEGLGSQIFEQTTQNPAQAIPDTNPFASGTNPFADTYVNPFAN